MIEEPCLDLGPAEQDGMLVVADGCDERLAVGGDVRDCASAAVEHTHQVVVLGGHDPVTFREPSLTEVDIAL